MLHHNFLKIQDEFVCVPEVNSSSNKMSVRVMKLIMFKTTITFIISIITIIVALHEYVLKKYCFAYVKPTFLECTRVNKERT